MRVKTGNAGFHALFQFELITQLWSENILSFANILFSTIRKDLIRSCNFSLFLFHFLHAVHFICGKVSLGNSKASSIDGFHIDVIKLESQNSEVLRILIYTRLKIKKVNLSTSFHSRSMFHFENTAIELPSFHSGEGKTRNDFAEWHVAWIAERHNYAEFNSWKMEQRNILNRKACVSLCRAFFVAKFEGEIARLKLKHSWYTKEVHSFIIALEGKKRSLNVKLG